MIFGPKIVCDQCGKKAKEATSTYLRGSRFCTPACAEAWSAANPAPVAQGDPAKLRAELAMLLDEAVTESKRSFNPAFGLNVGGNVQLNIGGPLGGMDARHRAEQMQTSRQQFQTYVLRAAPILRALGFAPQASAIDATDFQKTSGYNLVETLTAVRAQV